MRRLSAGALGLAIAIGCAFAFTGTLRAAGAAAKPEPIISAQARGTATSAGAGSVEVEARITAGYHVNSHTPSEDYLIATVVRIEPASGVTAGTPRYPPGESKKFSFSDKPLSVYEGSFRVTVPVTWGGSAAPPLAGAIDFQACTDTQCFPPASVPFRVEFAQAAPAAALSGGAVPLDRAPAAGAADASSSSPLSPSLPSAAGASQNFEEQLNRRGLPLVLLLLFGGGLALNLTPCVYPVIPLTLSYFAGQTSVQGRRPFRLAAVYVLGMATMYSGLGVAAALSGRLFGSALQSPWIVGAVAAVLVALAFSMFGFYDLQMPSALMQKAGARSGMAGAYAMGLLVGVVAAPCVGPFVLGLLAFVAARQQPGLGFLLFFVLSLGLGVPYLFLGAFSGSIARLPRAGMWMVSVKKAFGWILLAMAAYFLRPIIPAPAGVWLLPAVLAAGAISLATRATGWRPVPRAAAALLFLAAAVFFAPHARREAGPSWNAYAAESVSGARRPAVIEFSAAWCVPCRELDEKTFSDSRVQQALSRRALYKADLTRGGSPETAAITAKYAILGVPTVVFLEASGQERSEVRLVGFEAADDFLKRLEKAP